ncbi:MAG: dissimilatory-type sulfite reductase subunit beta [Nitrospinota bacterium]|nr:dissimilatory-type sulfite reductase subunit beta [Nitrospinota bacterium]MDH5678592.1 dissimilatory-type sulfite reductase subunit beta [Nitrospinota bacterium]MDH5756974.1 dissimilatory-type sulfite reductase subunit beta [Nitrospinota bacterium]
MAEEKKRGPRDNGAPDYQKNLHPLMAKNYGQWKYHEKIKPGVLVHVAENGDKLYTVRAGSPRTMSIDTVRKICDIADKYCQGHLRFTSRANVEFLLAKKKDVAPLIKEVKEVLGWPVGGTGHSISNVLHTQGWLHCNLPGTDAAGSVKALMDTLMKEFESDNDLPARVKISASCCQINCGGQGDIAINLQHHHPPVTKPEGVGICELPKVVAICPVAAIRPRQQDDGVTTLEVVEEKCMYCGACHGQCPTMEIRDAKTDTLTIWIGGKTASTRNGPSFMKLAVWGLPNNPPRWTEVSDAVHKILDAYKATAYKYERMGEWVERISWKRFFELTGFPFTKYHIDDSEMARTTYNTSAQVRF